MIILASKSPRRQELLKKLFNDFEIVPANIDEEKYPLDQVSLEKAKVIAYSRKSDIIIAADTYVKLNDKIFGKPKNENDAKSMLLELSNKPHEVITYYTIMNLSNRILLTNHVVTNVYFANLSSELIDAYVASKSPLDKAGAYGIQDNDKFHIIDKIDGSLENVIGLPVDELRNDLNRLGIKTL